MSDAPFHGVLHQNLKNDRVQMQMQMAVDVIQRQAGGPKLLELSREFAAQLRAQGLLHKIAETGFRWSIAEVSLSIDQTGDFFFRPLRVAADQSQVQSDTEPGIFFR